MKFGSLEEAESAYTTLEEKVTGLESEKAKLLLKRDELLGEVKNLKTKFAKFSDYADQDLDIPALLVAKEQLDNGDLASKSKYEAAYLADKAKFEQRLKALEEERAAEKAAAEQASSQAKQAQLKATAIAELSKDSYRIRNPEQFWRLFGDKIQLDDDGKLFIGDEYKQMSVGEYIGKIADDDDNAHHFKPKGGSGSGTGQGSTGGRGQPNPFVKGPGFNLTKQGQIFRDNPELYARLKAEAAGQ